MLAFPFGEYRDTEQVLLAQCQREVYAKSERIEQFTDRTGSGYERLLYVHEDLQGNTRYYTKDNGQSFAELTYDAWGMPESPNKLLNNDHGNYVYATYTGHIFDTTLDIYFAEARFYDAQTRQWLAMDPIKDGGNWYQYCYSNPLTYWDPLGLSPLEITLEIGRTAINSLTRVNNSAGSRFSQYRACPDGGENIVISGGPASTDNFRYQFIETAIRDMLDTIAEGAAPKNITWIVYNVGYTSDDISDYRLTAGKMGVNIVVVNDKLEMVDYINNRNGDRSGFPIVNISIYAHAQTPNYSGSLQNQLSFAYNQDDLGGRSPEDINFTQEDISLLDRNAFNNASTIFYSCNAGTKDGSGTSFAQSWSNLTGGTSVGIQNGRSDYSFINTTGNVGYKMGDNFTPADYILGGLDYIGIESELWNEKQVKSSERLLEDGSIGYAESGSLNYPTMTALVGDFDPVLDGGAMTMAGQFIRRNNC